MANCYDCEAALTGTNRSIEHVVGNAIGGRLQSEDLLCIECNNRHGRGPDAALARYLNHLANPLNVSRHRGEPPALEATLEDGRKVLIDPDGTPRLRKPEITVRRDGNQVSINISAPTERIGREVMEGLKRRWPQIDVDAFMQSAKPVQEARRGRYTIAVEPGGSEAVRAIAKTAVSFYMLRAGDRQQIAHLLPYLRGQASSLHIVHRFEPDPPLIPTGGSEIHHALTLRGDSTERLLYAHLDFSCHGYVVRLNDDYTGPEVTEYLFDVVQTREVKRTHPVSLTRSQLDALREPREFTMPRFPRVMWLATRNQRIGRVIREAFADLKTMGKEEMDADGASLIATRIAEEFTPEIQHAEKRLAAAVKTLKRWLIRHLIRMTCRCRQR